MAVQVTLYLNESDKWQGQPLHLAALNYLHENVFAAGVFRVRRRLFGPAAGQNQSSG
jgi:hypothetical protein